MKKEDIEAIFIAVVILVVGVLLGAAPIGKALHLGNSKEMTTSLVNSVDSISCGSTEKPGWVVSDKPTFYALPRGCVQACLDWKPTTDLAKPTTIAFDGKSCEIK